MGADADSGAGPRTTQSVLKVYFFFLLNKCLISAPCVSFPEKRWGRLAPRGGLSSCAGLVAGDSAQSAPASVNAGGTSCVFPTPLHHHHHKKPQGGGGLVPKISAVMRETKGSRNSAWGVQSRLRSLGWDGSMSWKLQFLFCKSSSVHCMLVL